jgi:lipopolysaccharide transport system permease protein
MMLLLGIMVMSFFNEGVMMGLGSLMSKAGIILKIKFPREIVVFSAVTISLLDFIFNMVVFAIFSIFTPVTVTPVSFILFLMAILSLYILITGVSLFLSIMYIKLRDIHNLMQVVLQLFFWLTPVYYQLEMLPKNLQRIVMLNPLTTILTLARKGLITGDQVVMTDFLDMTKIFLVCLLVLIVGIIFFRKRVVKIAEYF